MNFTRKYRFGGICPFRDGSPFGGNRNASSPSCARLCAGRLNAGLSGIRSRACAIRDQLIAAWQDRLRIWPGSRRVNRMGDDPTLIDEVGGAGNINAQLLPPCSNEMRRATSSASSTKAARHRPSLAICISLRERVLLRCIHHRRWLQVHPERWPVFLWRVQGHTICCQTRAAPA
jgi:hypothetical protein